MTETLTDPTGPPPPPEPRRLVRDPDDRVLAGVCAAFGRYTDTDPVLWRVAVAVLTVFGGAGLGLYALGWLLLPRTGQSQSAAERYLRRPDRTLTVLGVVAVGAVVLCVLLGLRLDGPGAGVALVLAGLVYLAVRERRDAPPRPAVDTSAEPLVPAAPRRRRERSPLGGVTLSVAALVTGALLAARAAGADGLTPPRVLAVALLVVGTGLLVGTWRGRARWLLPVGLLLAGLLAATAVAERVDGGVGERTWRAADGGRYELGAGEAVLDLRGLRGTDAADVAARVGVGELVVLVPTGLTVAVVADLGAAGEIRTPSGSSDDLHQEFVVGPGDPTVTLDLEVGVGEIEVRRVAS